MPEKPTSSKTPSPFSRSFASALRGFVRERGLRQKDLAKLIDRSPGYVSEHLSGLRAVDTDLLDAAADLAGVNTRDLYDILGRRMADGDTAARHTSESVDDAADRIAAKARKEVQGMARRKPRKQPDAPVEKGSA